ncbi:YncE family protein [Jeongeupia chitinilytica]|uniref:WD40 repeat domain-containing protein n=1 Tax=Jeongeupia chitinilytica TaxID=1041641 RepID=A0ABQ3H3G0_9NEIS|nr:hypothetical protein [Jeongeupia chitinilytica]GHD64424.1 hypothetical protein GCM10007350_23610 [Jeongeupia chitinilytica]
MKSRKLVSLKITTSLTLAFSFTQAHATDWNAITKSLQQLQPLAQKIDSDNAQRREQEANESAQRDAAEARKKQQEAVKRQQAAATQKQAQDDEIRLLTPPKEMANRLVFNRRQLERTTTSQGGEAFSISGKSFVTVSNDGRQLAYINSSRQLVLRPAAGGAERVVRDGLSTDGSWFIQFAGPDTLILTDSGPQKLTELIDVQGTRLASWNGAEYQVYAYEGKVRASHASYYPVKYCKGITIYDQRGTLLQQLDLSGERFERCESRLNANGKLEVQASHGSSVSYYVDGQRVSQFVGDTRRPKEEWGAVFYTWLGQLPYVISWVSDNDSAPYRVWDLQQGRMLCELPRAGMYSWMLADAQNHVFITTPPTRVTLPDCQQSILASSGNLRSDGDIAWIFQPGNGELAVLDAATLQVRKRISTKLRGDAVQIQRLRTNPRFISVGPSGWSAKEGDVTQIYDLESGNLAQELPGGFGFDDAFTIMTSSESRDGQSVWISKGWRVALGGAPGNQQQFMQALKKDKYESTSEYKARVAKLSQPFEMEISVVDYDADNSYFSGTWQGVPIGVPMPATQARKLDGMSTLLLKGQLGVIDDNFVELRNASVMLPDGTSLAVPQTKAQQAGTPVSPPKVSSTKPAKS